MDVTSTYHVRHITHQRSYICRYADISSPRLMDHLIPPAAVDSLSSLRTPVV